MMTYNETVSQTREDILNNLLDELDTIEKDETREIYFHDIVSENVDSAIAGNSREQNMEIIDDTGNEDHVDQGIIDNSSLDRMIETMAYGCIVAELFNDDFLCSRLQNALNNEVVDYETARQLITEIKQELNQE